MKGRGVLTRRMLVVAAVAVCPLALFAGPAQAALLPPLLPSPKPPSPRPTPRPGPAPIVSSGANVTAYAGGPDRASVAHSEAVFGPLYRSWRKVFPDAPSQPLIVGNTLLVNVAHAGVYGSDLYAFSRASGKRIWRQSLPGTYFAAPIATDGTRVVAYNFDGLARAFDVRSGHELWRTQLSEDFSTPPLIVNGRVLVSNEHGRMTALSAATGTVLWRSDVPRDDYVPEIPLAADSARLYYAGGCGNAAALNQATGALVWERRVGACADGEGATLAGGRLFAQGTGRAYDAPSGADAHGLPHPSGGSAAIAGGVAYQSGRVLQAISLASGRTLWSSHTSRKEAFGAEPHQPVVNGGTVYATTAARRLYGVDRATGRVRFSAGLPDESYSSHGFVYGGISVGQGVLAVTQGKSLSVYAPVLRPGRRGADMAFTSLDVRVGQRVGSIAGLAPRLRRRGRRVALQLDRFPRGRFRTAARGRLLGDGTVEFAGRKLTRNTRIRSISGKAASRPITVYAYPRFSLRVKRRGRRFGLARVGIRGPRELHAAGRRVVVYLARARSRRYVRLGAGHLRGHGAGRAVALARIHLVSHVGSHDFVAACVRGLSRQGFGRRDGLDRRCGRRRVRF